MGMTFQGELRGERFPGFVFDRAPRNVYWETTLACDLACKHCRANAIHHADPEQLGFEEGVALLEDVQRMGSMLILTGGDPMKRPDLFELIEHGQRIGLAMSITPSTTETLTHDAVRRFKELGIKAMGLSLDGPNPQTHDAFRGVEGTFESSRRALEWAREHTIPVQINTTVTGETLDGLPELYEFLVQHASPPVRRWSLFLLVPVGRGSGLSIPTAERVEELFAWVYEVSRGAPFHVSTVEAPHYRRYWIQRRLAEGTPESELTALARRMGFGVRDGNGVVFVSHRGEVYPAGFLPHPLLGNVRERPLSEIYREHPALLQLRDMDRLRGKCGECDFRWCCGGSRARAWAMTGDLRGSDPFCAYQPGAGATLAS
ncbi:MAG TPA: TIGR04053 family radical SAM/SPASM domain-containing protein [Thermoanaerobaculia bacterium]|nr:TIGR04053 family radical SAM/SPASM domain-containing protein [Thermoanaerobaculia bacterium]